MALGNRARMDQHGTQTIPEHSGTIQIDGGSRPPKRALEPDIDRCEGPGVCHRAFARFRSMGTVADSDKWLGPARIQRCGRRIGVFLPRGGTTLIARLSLI